MDTTPVYVFKGTDEEFRRVNIHRLMQELISQKRVAQQQAATGTVTPVTMAAGDENPQDPDTDLVCTLVVQPTPEGSTETPCTVSFECSWVSK